MSQQISPPDVRQQQLVAWINQHTEYQTSNIVMVSGDASFRRYFRTFTSPALIAVDAPPPDEDSQVFVDVASALRQQGVPVPEVYAHDAEQGMYLLEDLGNTVLSDTLSDTNFISLYRRALALLPGIQACTRTAAGELPRFDEALLAREFHLFRHWLLEEHLGLSVNSEERRMLNDIEQRLQDNFFAQPQAGVHRDYHSRNIMIDGDEQLRIIDFQDAVLGPITYDAVSLLRDCYQCWPESDVEMLTREHWQQCHRQYSWQEFARWFDLTGIQRHVKASGIFARLCHRDGKSTYLHDIPNTLRHLIRVGHRYDQFAAFANWVSSTVLPAVEAKLGR
ncbi:aminoglycoside phosphotransferase family protein [Aestuariibacter salexigens]|uniref:aminoglycoside phosphotransferase family protein n=1 Tax=Aestuariibacter salexigens TaxID=226010 RepID=UPI0003FF2909|nr:phosphotransferase [Aestuariibacter salexigens]